MSDKEHNEPAFDSWREMRRWWIGRWEVRGECIAELEANLARARAERDDEQGMRARAETRIAELDAEVKRLTDTHVIARILLEDEGHGAVLSEEQFEDALASEHCGDCTAVSGVCERCVAESVLKGAEYLVAALRGEEAPDGELGLKAAWKCAWQAEEDHMEDACTCGHKLEQHQLNRSCHVCNCDNFRGETPDGKEG